MHRSGILSMTPLYFPSRTAPVAVWCGPAALQQPLFSLALAPFLCVSLRLVRRQLFSSSCTHAHRHADTLRHTHELTHARTPCRLPLYIMQLCGAVSLPALNYSCQRGGQSHWGCRHHFLFIPKSDNTQADARERLCSLCCHQLFPRCCLLGQPVSRR